MMFFFAPEEHLLNYKVLHQCSLKKTTQAKSSWQPLDFGFRPWRNEDGEKDMLCLEGSWLLTGSVW